VTQVYSRRSHSQTIHRIEKSFHTHTLRICGFQFLQKKNRFFDPKQRERSLKLLKNLVNTRPALFSVSVNCRLLMSKRNRSSAPVCTSSTYRSDLSMLAPNLNSLANVSTIYAKLRTARNGAADNPFVTGLSWYICSFSESPFQSISWYLLYRWSVTNCRYILPMSQDKTYLYNRNKSIVLNRTCWISRPVINDAEYRNVYDSRLCSRFLVYVFLHELMILFL